MTSKTKQKNLIRKRKKHAHKTNIKTNLKRVAKNHDIIFASTQGAKEAVPE